MHAIINEPLIPVMAEEGKKEKNKYERGNTGRQKKQVTRRKVTDRQNGVMYVLINERLIPFMA